MDSKTKASITIHYLLDEAGRREALSLGMPATERQTIVVGPEDDGFDEALALASVSTDGEAVFNVGHYTRELRGVVTYHGIPTPKRQDKEVVARNNVKEWPEPQSAATLIVWEADRRTRVEKIHTADAKKSAVLAEQQRQERIEAAAKRKSISEEVRNDDLETLAQIVMEMSPEETKDETICQAVECARENISAMHFHSTNLPNVRGALTEHRERIKREAWISERGSVRLRRCVTEGIAYDAIYRDERFAYERPGWRWATDVRGNSDVPRNPPTDAFALLDAARTFDGDAGIEYWTARERATDEAGYDEDLMPWVFRGHVATAQFLGREIVFFGAQDAPE